MHAGQSPGHAKWECKHHVVWMPKCRKKALFVELRNCLGEILMELAKQKECEAMEGHPVPGHVHVMLSMPPKHSASQVVGFVKGRIAVQIARDFFVLSSCRNMTTSGPEIPANEILFSPLERTFRSVEIAILPSQANVFLNQQDVSTRPLAAKQGMRLGRSLQRRCAFLARRKTTDRRHGVDF